DPALCHLALGHGISLQSFDRQRAGCAKVANPLAINRNPLAIDVFLPPPHPLGTDLVLPPPHPSSFDRPVTARGDGTAIGRAEDGEIATLRHERLRLVPGWDQAAVVWGGGRPRHR